MAHILCIETTSNICSVSLANNDNVLVSRETDEQNAHSRILTIFVNELFEESGISINQLDAVAVSMGPGSYTGLRIGVSAAKGLCYAMDIPLIAVPTLQALALGGISEHPVPKTENVLYCPMIDARRMEVYSALYDRENKEIRGVEAEIITETSFSGFLDDHRLILFGNGAEKCREVLPPGEKISYLTDVCLSAKYLVTIAHERYLIKDFEDVAYFEPFYLKEFIAGKPKVKGLI